MESLVSDESSDGSDPESPDSTLASLSLSLTGSYAQLPCPQPSRSPDTHRARRPRTHTAGNILISRPVSECELRASASEYQSESGENKPCLMERSGSTAASPAPSGAERNCSGSEASDGQLSIITSTPSSLRSDAARAGPARRSPPAPLNRSYDVENPSPSLNRPQISVTDQTAVEQQIHALKRLEREQTHQISELLAAQERQTQELQRKLKEQSRKSMMSSAPQINTRQDVCVEPTKPLCRLTAVARGFLTRRLLHTEKISHLRKTVQDSRAFIHQLKTISVSHQDLTLQQRVTAQLRSALQDVHQIFFIWPLRDRLHLMQQDRERRRERTLREMKTDSAGNTRTLSSATQKTLDRKGQRILQSRLRPNTSCSPQSALKKRDGCVGARQHSLQRKYLSLG
ncbi:centriolar coiled-coil protein of 110 kDa [Rhinichthys klamathensis goyatoka]|uniref:centriolar coiled-coil protein of 110 kDa n=1 Tax=Rhinichthys klamathensis goyatoka TaxID=3034132 RepID=UPI0024B5437D|nr:centriolar coiled-coil protein of 110 kDa [Rhinichthys klamathensis goyatoka]